MKQGYAVRFGIVVHGTIYVNADSLEEAMEKVKEKWEKGKLDIDDYADCMQPNDKEDLMFAGVDKVPYEVTEDDDNEDDDDDEYLDVY